MSATQSNCNSRTGEPLDQPPPPDNASFPPQPRHGFFHHHGICFTTGCHPSRRPGLCRGARPGRRSPAVRPSAGKRRGPSPPRGGQALERAGMDVIRRFARLRLSGCHPDSASNVSCRGRPGRSSPTRPLSSQPTSGPLRLSPRGPETPYQHGQAGEFSGCSSTGGRSRGAACRRPLVGSCPAAGSRAPPLRQIAGPAGRGQMGERGSGGEINRCHR